VVPGGLKIVECAEGVTEQEMRDATAATIIPASPLG
jgi:3-oxoacid CoA-transferase subunit B